MAVMHRHAWPMKRRWVVIPVLALAACSGGTDSGTSATTVAAVTSAPTTAAPTTTEAPSTTTTIPATTTTEAPTTTTIPLEDELRAAVVANYAAYNACLADPANCHPELIATGHTLDAISATVHDMIGFDLYAAPNVEAPERLVVGTITVSNDRTSATIELCHWDTAIVYSRPTSPGAQPLVVNDENATRWIRETWQLDGGRWLPTQVDLNARPKVVGEDRCDDA